VRGDDANVVMPMRHCFVFVFKFWYSVLGNLVYVSALGFCRFWEKKNPVVLSGRNRVLHFLFFLPVDSSLQSEARWRSSRHCCESACLWKEFAHAEKWRNTIAF
jgi:hypothetical protein